MDATFPKSRRLLTAADYRAVFSAVTTKCGTDGFLLLARPSVTTQHRLGLAVAKKHVKTAVGRNRIKRIARERFRQLPAPVTPLDIILLTRPGARDLDKGALATTITRQFQRLLERASS